MAELDGRVSSHHHRKPVSDVQNLDITTTNLWRGFTWLHMRNYKIKLARKIFGSFKGISVEMEYGGVVEKAAMILGYPSVKEKQKKKL